MSRPLGWQPKPLRSRPLVRSAVAGLGALLLLPVACGAQPGSALAFDLKLQTLSGDELLQLVIVRPLDAKGVELRCSDLQATCLADQSALRFVPIAGADYLRVPLDAAAASSATGQALELTDIEPGSGYYLVAELVRSGASGEQRVGVGCTVLPEIHRGKNPQLSSPLEVLEGQGGCNPSLEGR